MMNIMSLIAKMVLAFAVSMSTANKTSMKKVTCKVIPQHVAERCVAVGTHTFRTPDGNLFDIQPNCEKLLVNETYRVVFWTAGTESRLDDEIVDFDELEVYEVDNGIGNPIKWGALD